MDLYNRIDMSKHAEYTLDTHIHFHCCSVYHAFRVGVVVHVLRNLT